ncbi:MAG: multicopper oxidase family protein [Dehalococcoidia bacterium]
MNAQLQNRKETDPVTRRSFLEKVLVGTGVLSVGAIAGSTGYVLGNSEPLASGIATGAASTTTAGHDMSASTVTDAAVPAAANSADEMDAHHAQGIKDFLANQTSPITKGLGNQPLAPRIENGVKVFELTCDEIDWEVSPGKVYPARGYNGAIPGPILRATEGDTVRIVVKNNLKESTSIHWHGLVVPNSMDGVPFLNQPPIKPGATFIYEFTLRNSGTHMYHSHHNSMDQVNRGLLGAFIVDPKDPSTYPQYDREFVMVLNDLNLGFTINGKGFPATEAVVAKKGERVLIRYLNEGVMNHPMHLHGMPQAVFAKDGYPINPPQLCDTIDVSPGNRYDVIVEATEPGAWAFHCHVLNHAEGPDGMFGLVTAMLVDVPLAAAAPARNEGITQVSTGAFLCPVEGVNNERV